MGEITLWEQAEKPKKERGGPGFGAYVRPWVTGAAMVPAGMAAHALWGDAGATTGLAAAAITAAGGASTWLTWRLVRARSWYTAVMATGTTGGITAWLGLATVAGTGRPMLDLLIVAGGALAGLSNAHTFARRSSGGSGGGGATAYDRPLPTWEQVAEVVGLSGTTMRVTEETELRRVGVVQLRPGDTADSIQGALASLASAMRLPRRAVRAVEDPDDCSQVRVTIVRRDVLREAVDWAGLPEELVGASIAEAPLELGVYEDGAPFTDDLFDHHTLTVGMSGSGKSNYGKLKAVQVGARADAVVLAIDLAKGRQTLGPVEGALLWSAYTRPDATAMLAALVHAVQDRANHLAKRGLENWQPDCGLTFVHVLIEEAAELVEIDTVVDVLRIARSTGIHIEMSLQRGTWTNLDTDARANLASRICLGVADERDAGFVLPDYVTEAGAAPEAWADRQQGCAYAAVKSQPANRHAVPLRFYRATNAQLAEAAGRCGDQDAKLDPITRAAFGAAYERYLARRTSGQAAGGPRDHDDQEHSGMTTAPKASRAERVARAVAADPDHDDEAAVTYATADPDPDIDADIDDPVEMPPGAALGGQPPRRSREGAAQARARLDAQLQLWADQGHRQFRAPELRDALRDQQGLVRARGWVITELARLETEGRIIHHDGGLYEIAATDRELVPA
ncbi:hypothetical protein HNR12_005646 [Streptomonospora nanhaiensis]|uniref:FtsK domain-containing protein n=1 Tax=Streptomonospora nanhaiensis TaxID=1323731 RepID=A0A853BYR6_9ACTN|nr:hypothetical protein [Streptomonospora nanhaiensis]NYI99292.1 hypothetical protein [Streptomonospora nanhaiensis]